MRARGAVVGVVSSTPVGIGVLFGSPEESGSAGWGGQFPGDPPQPGWFIYKASALGQKGAPGGHTTGPAAGVGSAWALTLWRGSPGKAPRAPFSALPPDTKACAGSSGSARWSIPTFRGPRAAGLSIIFRFQSPGPEGLPPHHANRPLSKKPLKSDWGFCRLISSPFSVFLFSLPPGRPLRTLLAPSPAFCPALPLLFPS